MPEFNRKDDGPNPPDFSRATVFVRWLLFMAESVIAIYFTITFRLDIGIFFIAYGVVCLLLLFPLIRCVRCVYYGRRCSLGLGRWVAELFPRDQQNPPGEYDGFNIVFWPLRIIPIILGIMSLIGGFMSKFTIIPHGLFAAYLLIILIQRRYYRSGACPTCAGAEIRPIDNSREVVQDYQK